MRLIVEMEQNPRLRWGAFVRQGAERGTDLLVGRNITDRAEAETAAKEALARELEGLPYTLEFAAAVK